MSKSKTSTPSPVQIEVHAAKKGKIGYLTLNVPSTLNSLTLEMVSILFEQLSQWEKDADIALVVLQGMGDKAFCAGGDVQQLYQSAVSQPGGPCDYAESFFLNEYRLNYTIHQYAKPILCLGHGIVMGGGLGLMAGCSHRLATPTTRIAMPEVTIGLFPDVGGTWFLSRMPRGLGLFFALTGAPLNANDALHMGLADAVIQPENIGKLLNDLTEQEWDTTERNHALLDELILVYGLSATALNHEIRSEIRPCLGTLEAICQQTSLGEVITSLNEYADKEDSKWFQKAVDTQAHGSPLSTLIIYEQLRRYHYADLKTVFQSEYTLATNVVRYPEFAEGVRALLIDKDKQPKWKFQHFSEVPASLLETFFTPPWENSPFLEFIEHG